MKKIILVAALLGFALIPAARAVTVNFDGQKPQMQFTAVDGRNVDLSKMKGKVVLVDFWATWCGPCRGKVPEIVSLYNKYHAKGLEVVGISLDQDKDALTEFTKAHDMAWPQFFDGRGWDNEISSALGVTSIPAMFLVGKDGKFVRGGGDLDEQIGKLLGAP